MSCYLEIAWVKGNATPLPSWGATASKLWVVTYVGDIGRDPGTLVSADGCTARLSHAVKY